MDCHGLDLLVFTSKLDLEPTGFELGHGLEFTGTDLGPSGLELGLDRGLVDLNLEPTGMDFGINLEFICLQLEINWQHFGLDLGRSNKCKYPQVSWEVSCQQQFTYAVMNPRIIKK